MTEKKVSASAWMPLWIGDYLADTNRLTTEQHGAYLLLIMDYWTNGPLPPDDKTLAQITRMSLDAWSNASSILLAFFEHRRGRLHHKRIDAEKEAAIKRASARSDKAHVAALARWSREKHKVNAPSTAPSMDATSNATSMPQAMLERCPPQSQSQSPLKPPLPENEITTSIGVINPETGEIETPFDRVLLFAGGVPA